MRAPLAQRAVALTLSLLITLGMLGGIDGLAVLERVSPIWAAAVSNTCV